MIDLRELSERVRRACIAAALQAWEDAGVQGLCAEGRWEVAVGTMRSLQLDAIIKSNAEAEDLAQESPDPMSLAVKK